MWAVMSGILLDLVLKPPTCYSIGGAEVDSSMQTEQVCGSFLALVSTAKEAEKLLFSPLSEPKGVLAGLPCAFITKTFLAQRSRCSKASLSSDWKFPGLPWGNSSRSQTSCLFTLWMKQYKPAHLPLLFLPVGPCLI